MTPPPTVRAAVETKAPYVASMRTAGRVAQSEGRAGRGVARGSLRASTDCARDGLPTSVAPPVGGVAPGQGEAFAVGVGAAPLPLARGRPLCIISGHGVVAVNAASQGDAAKIGDNACCSKELETEGGIV